MGVQTFVGQSPWDHRPMVQELVRQVGRELGQADAVIMFDPSGYPKKGARSVGVARQWLGRLGKVDNGQVPRKWNTPWSTHAFIFPKSGPTTNSSASKQVSPRTKCGSARGISWPWRCSTTMARCCPMRGWLATTKWAVPPVSAEIWPIVRSSTCWRCRPIRRSATWKKSLRNRRAVVASGRFPSVKSASGWTNFRRMRGPA